jgi:hypothetical protein
MHVSLTCFKPIFHVMLINAWLCLCTWFTNANARLTPGCYSCHLLDGLVACDSVEAYEKIVRSSGEWFVRGIVLVPREPRRATLIKRVIEILSLMGRFLRCPTCGLGGWCQLAIEPPGERSTQWGCILVATSRTSEEKSLCQHCLNHLLGGLHSAKHKLVLLSYTLCLCSCSCD